MVKAFLSHVEKSVVVALKLVAELQEPQTSASEFVVAELLAFLSSSDEFRYVGISIIISLCLGRFAYKWALCISEIGELRTAQDLKVDVID